MRYIIDLETTVNGGPEGDSPEAHWLNNRVLLCGWQKTACPVSVGYERFIEDLKQSYENNQPIVIIGHNLKFDLKYLIRDHPNIPWHKFHYICTMHRAYLLSGHKDKFMGLEDACANHSIVFVKGLDLTAILASGTKMEDIPIADLDKYLREDVGATYKLFHAQANQVPLHNPMASDQTLPLAAMELAGMKLDTPRTKQRMASLVHAEEQYAKILFTQCNTRLEWNDGVPLKMEDIKFNAPRTISYLLTGFPTTGLPKGKRRVQFRGGATPILSTLDTAALWPKVRPTHLGFPVPADKLEELKARGLKLPDVVLKYRAIQKLSGTYYGPFLHKAAVQGYVYPNIHMVSTNTGRTSSTDPNGQNMPPPARECFISEYGRMVEIDFKQLEIVAVAAVSGDKQLIKDLNDGVDTHYETGRRVMKWKVPADMTEETRRVVKAVNFGVLYGGGPNGLAAQTGQPKSLIKDLIKAFYARYPGVAEWQKDFYTDVTKGMKPDGIQDGEQIYCSDIRLAISGRLFHFKESKSPVWLRKKTGRKFSFKPTETKNYPIQGFAGGDIVMDALVLLYKALKQRHYGHATQIRMTVHDSLVLDTDLSDKVITVIMNDVCKQIVAKYCMPIQLKFDLKSDTHWK